MYTTWGWGVWWRGSPVCASLLQACMLAEIHNREKKGAKEEVKSPWRRDGLRAARGRKTNIEIKLKKIIIMVVGALEEAGRGF